MAVQGDDSNISLLYEKGCFGILFHFCQLIFQHVVMIGKLYYSFIHIINPPFSYGEN